MISHRGGMPTLSYSSPSLHWFLRQVKRILISGIFLFFSSVQIQIHPFSSYKRKKKLCFLLKKSLPWHCRMILQWVILEQPISVFYPDAFFSKYSLKCQIHSKNIDISIPSQHQTCSWDPVSYSTQHVSATLFSEYVLFYSEAVFSLSC